MLCLALDGKLGKFFTQGIKLLLSEFIQNSLPRLHSFLIRLKPHNLQFSAETSLKLVPICNLNKVWGACRGKEGLGERGWQGGRADADSGAFQLASPTLAHFTVPPRFATFPSDFAADFLPRPPPRRTGGRECTSSGDSEWLKRDTDNFLKLKRDTDKLKGDTDNLKGDTDNFLICHTLPSSHVSVFGYFEKNWLPIFTDFPMCMWSLTYS